MEVHAKVTLLHAAAAPAAAFMIRSGFMAGKPSGYTVKVKHGDSQ
jgi:hypothetical protein